MRAISCRFDSGSGYDDKSKVQGAKCKNLHFALFVLDFTLFINLSHISTILTLYSDVLSSISSGGFVFKEQKDCLRLNHFPKKQETI